MVEERAPVRCPRCSVPLPPGAPAGICPKCLLEAGMKAGGESKPLAKTTPAPRFTAPAVEEVAEAFPQLEVLALIGCGGMGAVYKARQKELDRVVAVKILPLEVGADPAFAERFLREARALARLNHPHIVSVYDFGQSGELGYFMMEFVEGTNLRHLLATRNLEPAQALSIIPQICSALQFAHNNGIVHRDIKPENILVSERGQVKIADFGLVKLLRTAPADDRLTGTQQVMGTLHYMAPEQVQHTQGVDHRADIYSLGVVFYEMLTGQLPIGRFDPPSKKVAMDARLDDIVLRSLEADPARRYQQVDEVKTDIESLFQGKPPRQQMAPKPAAAPQARQPSLSASRYSRKAIVGAIWAPLFFIAASLLIVPFWTLERRPPPDATMEVTTTPTGSAAEPAEAAATGRNGGSAGLRMTPGLAILPFLFALVVGLPAITAPIGTTLLGVLAISDIRHSEGRLRGLPLAVFDALFYPLLLLDLLVFAACAVIGQGLALVVFRFLDLAAFDTLLVLAGTVLVSIPLCLVIDLLIVRAVWQQCSANSK